eukprot:GHUV01028556.1.p1 GENE.GHUV01028556.1~~GHUV01028556.1.p1  ORF type:complete len:268 (+),score=18.37 GHUV01028556.1:237-1040(+)
MAGLRPFSDLKCISKQTIEVVDRLGFNTTTPVQEATIPLFCGNKDVAVDACTGSGKTLAFVIPVIEKLRSLKTKLKPHQVGAIIVSPTRELAKQIHTVAAPFVASVPGLSALLLVGGTDPSQDVAAFKSCGGNLLIGTPGRLDDIMKRLGGAGDTKKLEVLVRWVPSSISLCDEVSVCCQFVVHSQLFPGSLLLVSHNTQDWLHAFLERGWLHCRYFYRLRRYSLQHVQVWLYALIQILCYKRCFLQLVDMAAQLHGWPATIQQPHP